ncbi:MAG: phytanoyl-CoA dioxygenase family protein [Planctomycetes bacterium]|nr:phytanoyl-CoA dioxygenase family protein [Planctomycetota bacterium]
MGLISDKEAAQFHELGYFVTEPMWGDAELGEVSREFDRLHAEAIVAAEKGGDANAIRLAKLRPFIGQAHTKSDALKRFVKSDIYVEACAKFIGPDADLYYNQVVIKPPEEGMSFAWHQDSGYAQTRPLEYLTCWTAISRTFVDNGCIWVLPKSHKLGLIEHRRDEKIQSMVPVKYDESTAIPVEMKPGQVAVFSSLTMHKSGPNISKEVRKGYVPQYHVPQVIRTDTGKPWGDLFPVLRGGKPVPRE